MMEGECGVKSSPILMTNVLFGKYGNAHFYVKYGLVSFLKLKFSSCEDLA